MRSAYCKWVSGKVSSRAAENKRLADKIEELHTESSDKGYRRFNDDLRHGKAFAGLLKRYFGE